jgi:hypothetical protein
MAYAAFTQHIPDVAEVRLREMDFRRDGYQRVLCSPHGSFVLVYADEGTLRSQMHDDFARMSRPSQRGVQDDIVRFEIETSHYFL